MLYFSAVAIQVGNVNSPVIQVYLKDTEEREQVEVYVGDKQVTASSIPDLSGIDIDMEGIMHIVRLSEDLKSMSKLSFMSNLIFFS